jgi:hypothetical protein
MGLRIEWRSKAEGDDALLAVEEDSNKILDFWEADPERLTDFLNDMNDLEGANGRDVNPPDPWDWGALVIARAADGEVLYIDPQLYWEGVAYWFRSRGADPHPWRGR